MHGLHQGLLPWHQALVAQQRVDTLSLLTELPQPLNECKLRRQCIVEHAGAAASDAASHACCVSCQTVVTCAC